MQNADLCLCHHMAFPSVRVNPPSAFLWGHLSCIIWGPHSAYCSQPGDLHRYHPSEGWSSSVVLIELSIRGALRTFLWVRCHLRCPQTPEGALRRGRVTGWWARRCRHSTNAWVILERSFSLSQTIPISQVNSATLPWSKTPISLCYSLILINPITLSPKDGEENLHVFQWKGFQTIREWVIYSDPRGSGTHSWVPLVTLAISLSLSFSLNTSIKNMYVNPSHGPLDSSNLFGSKDVNSVILMS